jgi:hypothetical protein
MMVNDGKYRSPLRVYFNTSGQRRPRTEDQASVKCPSQLTQLVAIPPLPKLTVFVHLMGSDESNRPWTRPSFAGRARCYFALNIVLLSLLCSLASPLASL